MKPVPKEIAGCIIFGLWGCGVGKNPVTREVKKCAGFLRVEL